MNKQEFGQIALAIKTYYPTDKVFATDVAIDLWFKHFEDIPYNVMSAAIEKWVLTNERSPSIAALRGMCVSITGGEVPDSGQAWEEVVNAIRKYGYYREGEALESLSPLARETTKQIGFYELCVSENQVADRAHFMQMYDQVARRHKTDSQLSEPLKQRIQEIRGKMIEG